MKDAVEKLDTRFSDSQRFPKRSEVFTGDPQSSIARFEPNFPHA